MKEPLTELVPKCIQAGRPVPFPSACSAPQALKWDPHVLAAAPEGMWGILVHEGAD